MNRENRLALALALSVPLFAALMPACVGGSSSGEGEGEGEGECACDAYSACACATDDPCGWQNDDRCDTTACEPFGRFTFDDSADCAGEGEGEGEGENCDDYNSYSCRLSDPCNWAVDGWCDTPDCDTAVGVGNSFDDSEDCRNNPPEDCRMMSSCAPEDPCDQRNNGYCEQPTCERALPPGTPVFDDSADCADINVTPAEGCHGLAINEDQCVGNVFSECRVDPLVGNPPVFISYDCADYGQDCGLINSLWGFMCLVPEGGECWSPENRVQYCADPDAACVETSGHGTCERGYEPCTFYGDVLANDSVQWTCVGEVYYQDCQLTGAFDDEPGRRRVHDCAADGSVCTPLGCARDHGEPCVQFWHVCGEEMDYCPDSGICP